MNDNRTYPNTQTFLIEASREDSLIDNKDNNDYNSKWTTETNFNLKRGDTVSVEMVALNAQNAGSSQTIEFTGEQVIVDGKKKPYCDNKVLLEVFFYINNNNTYSVGLPLRHPEGSFDDTTYPAQKYMPVNQGENTGGAINNYRGATLTPGTMSFLGIGTVGSGTGAFVSQVMDATTAHFAVAFIKDDGTTVTTVTPSDMIESIILGKSGDTNPNSGQPTSFNGWLRGDASPNELCNALANMMWGIEDSAGELEVNAIVIRDFEEQAGSTGRLQINLVEPTQLSPNNNVVAGALWALNWQIEYFGTSEIGLVNYDNLNPATFVTTNKPPMMAKNSSLSTYMNNIGYTGSSMSSEFRHFNNAVYGSSGHRYLGNVATANKDDPGANRGFRCHNPRYDNNSKPYIFTRNDWCGIGRRQPGGQNWGKFLPKLEPLSTFILLEADELFTDVNSLAQKINDKLHETLNLFNTEIPEQDNFLTNNELYPNPNSKASSVLPLVQNNGFIDKSETSGLSQENYALWDTISPIKYGGTVKLQPANFDDGINYLASGNGTSAVNKETEIYNKTTYINKCTNMSYNPEKVENPIYGNCGYINFFKMQLGDRWARLPCDAMLSLNSRVSGQIGDRCIGRPVILNNRLRYDAITVQNALGTTQEYSTYLEKHQLIFTNIQFPLRDSAGDITPPDAPSLFEDFAEQVRKYEIYANKQGVKDYAKQNSTIDWVFDFDLGITNDSDTSFLDPTSTPSPTSTFSPIKCRWTEQYPATADAGTHTYGTAVNTTNRPLISPVKSNVRFGSGNNFDYFSEFQAYRPLGSLIVEARFDPNYLETSIQIQDQLSGEVDPRCTLIDVEEYKEHNAQYPDIDIMQKLNLGLYPYEYLTEDGEKKVLTAIRVGADYEASDNNPPSLNISTITWGLPIGVSPSAVDNHIIVPMNADFKDTNVNWDNSSSSTPYLNRYLRYNRINQIWVGANNPTFQFNADKNRYEFINLQSDQLLSSFNTAQSGGGVSSQLGDKVGIVNTVTGDAVFSEITGKSSYTKGVRDSIGGVGVYNVWLCPPDYTPPAGVSLANYWDNTTIDQTQKNHDLITAGCTKASPKDWEGCLLDRCGFDYYSLFPKYGRQYNRFDPATYNNEDPALIGTGTKPLLLNNSLDNVTNPSLSVYYNPTVSPPTSAIPTGVPNFGLSLNANLPVLLSTQSLPLTATNSPILTTSPFYIVYSDIVGERNYQSGSTPLPAIFYCMRNYSSSGFFYGYGSTFQIMVNQDRVLSLINTEIRNPNGELAKLSKNSTIMYKIQRQSIVPPPMVDVFGLLENQANPDPNDTELNQLLTSGHGTGVSNSIAGGTGDRSGGRRGGKGSNVIRVPTVILNNTAQHLDTVATQTLQSGGTQTTDAGSQAIPTSRVATTQAGIPDVVQAQNEIGTMTEAPPQLNEVAVQARIVPETQEAETQEQIEMIDAGVGEDTSVLQNPRIGIGISEIDEKVVETIIRGIMAKLTESYRINKTKDGRPSNAVDFDDLNSGYFPISFKKGERMADALAYAIRQVFTKLDIDAILQIANNDPNLLIDVLGGAPLPPGTSQPEGVPTGILNNLVFNSKGQVTFNPDRSDNIAMERPQFYLEATELAQNPKLREIISLIIKDNLNRYDAVGKRTYTALQKKLRQMERSGDLVGVFEPEGQDGTKIIFTNLTERPPEGQPHTYALYDEQVQGEFLETPQESLQELKGINYIYAGDYKTLNPADLEGYLDYLQTSIKPEKRLTRAEAEQRRMDIATKKGRLNEYLADKLQRQIEKSKPPQGAGAQGTGATKDDQPPPPPPQGGAGGQDIDV